MSAHKQDDWFPLGEDEHARQVDAILRLCRSAGVLSALDLGVGDGRIAAPIAASGVRVLAIDRDAEALNALRDSSAGVELRTQDFLDPDASFDFADGARPQAAWCLGNTLLQIHDVGRAVALMRRLRGAMTQPGWLAIDNLTHDLWRDIAEGNWQEGVSEDSQWQMVWVDGDEVVALRRGDGVDPDDWSVRDGDRLIRLWSLGSLRLLALASGWSGPDPDPTGALLIFRPV